MMKSRVDYTRMGSTHDSLSTADLGDSGLI